ncbi:MAG: glycosyltransferase family 2 protein [Saprospiraceae bacterium]|nr:glycosyltransferase family 2 protein [Saprospiraceae bacterium]
MILDIIIPIFNPLDDWAPEVIRQYNELSERLPENLATTLIMVNDGSDYELEEDAQKIVDAIPGTQWVSYKENHGKGYALREGVKLSQGDYIMYTDYDFPYTYGSMISMIEKLIVPGVDAVVGNRDTSYYNHISSRRKRISQYLRQVNKLLFRLPTDDTQCGLKAFNASKKDLFLSTRTNRYLIDVEFLKKLARSNSKVDIQLVKLRSNVVLSKISNLRLIKELYNYIVIMLS